MHLDQITDIEIDGLDTKDYPDFCDAYISYACYNGEPMTEVQLDLLNDNYSDFVNEKAHEHYF